MKTLTLLIISSTIVLCSCEATLRATLSSSPSAKAEALIEADAQMIEKCQWLGIVEGSSVLGMELGDTSINNAIIEAKEHAVELGATHIVFSAKKAANTQGGSDVSAKAYKCN